MSTNPFKENNGLFSKNGGVFEVFTPPNKITISENRLITKVFLAGTIDMGNSENWQEKFINKLKEQSTRGLFAKSGKLFVICPDEFYRSGNVQIICNKFNIPLYKSIEELTL